MSITTYAELKSAIGDFLNRDDLTAVIPTFVSLAEARIARDLRHWKQDRRVTTDVDERYENLPFDWISIHMVEHTDGGEISSVSNTEMAALRANSTTPGKPRFFKNNANDMEFYPAPDATYNITMVYQARIPSLSVKTLTQIGSYYRRQMLCYMRPLCSLRHILQTTTALKSGRSYTRAQFKRLTPKTRHRECLVR